MERPIREEMEEGRQTAALRKMETVENTQCCIKLLLLIIRHKEGYNVTRENLNIILLLLIL